MTALEFEEKALAWTTVAQWFAAAPYWWIGTCGSSGPHAIPVWGVVVADVLCFYGEPDTLRSRQLAADHRVVLHLPDPTDVLVVKGSAKEGGPVRVRADVCAAYAEKYSAPDDARWLPDARGMETSLLYTVTPHRAFAFQPADASVWTKRVWVEDKG